VSWKHPNSSKMPTVHRVKSTYKGEKYDVITQGDNNEYFEQIREEWIRGRATAILQT